MQSGRPHAAATVLIDTALTGLQRVVSKEFVLGTFFPMLLFVAFSAWLAAAASGESGKLVREVETLPAVTQGLLFAASVILLGAVGYLVAALQSSLVRLLAGYWPRIRWLGWLRDRMIARQRVTWERLFRAERAAAENGHVVDQNSIQLFMAQRYPPKTRLDLLMPTRLGNILRAAEAYPSERYGIDPVVIWPRLRPLLPEKVAADLVGDRSSLDALLLLQTLGGIFGTAWPVTLLALGQDWPLAALALVGWPLAMIAHRSAQAAAVGYGERFRVTFDLYRHELLHHLGITVPGQLGSERDLWDDLGQFYFRNLPLDLEADVP